jgi:chromate transport protein ChrA
MYLLTHEAIVTIIAILVILITAFKHRDNIVGQAYANPFTYIVVFAAFFLYGLTFNTVVLILGAGAAYLYYTGIGALSKRMSN